jgi:glyoxylase-like metal-dependent hydrolase (beta-lactamase superfamily II)
MHTPTLRAILGAIPGNPAVRRLAAAAVATAALCAAFAAPAAAAAPLAKISAPGFYRFMLGDFEITALSDGTLGLPADQLLTNTTPEKVRAALAKSYLSTPLETSVNAFLVNTGPKLVLIDTGTGNAMGPSLGKLADNLKASGYEPAQVDEIFITHLHGDHIGGLAVGDKPVFPNAVLRVDQADADHYLSEHALESASADEKGGIAAAMAAVNPYVKAGHFRPFDSDRELVPGIHSLATHGHTPGHNNYVIESHGQKLVLWGDLIHVGAVQFEDPSVTVKFDSSPAAAERNRKAAFADAAKNGYLVGAAHLPFPGIGHLRAEGAGYVWIPLNYSTMR